MISIKDMVKDGQKVKFICYRLGELWYKTETGFDFPVPISDCGDGVFLAEDKAMLYMRYIRKYIKFLEEAKASVDLTIETSADDIEHPLTMTETVKALVSESIKIDQHRGYGSVVEHPLTNVDKRNEAIERMNAIQNEPYDEMDDYHGS